MSLNISRREFVVRRVSFALILLSLLHAPGLADDVKPTPGTDESRAVPHKLAEAVYAQTAWIESAKTFRVQTEYTIIRTEKGLKATPPQLLGPAEPIDPRPFHVVTTWSWNDSRIRYETQSFYEGDEPLGTGTRVWNGDLAIEAFESTDKTRHSYVLSSDALRFFESPGRMWSLPWGHNTDRTFSWRPIDIAKKKRSFYLVPEDFDLVGEEEVNGRPCRVLESAAGHYRMFVGAADGRLYKRESAGVSPQSTDFDRLKLRSSVAGKTISSNAEWTEWVESRSQDEIFQDQRAMAIAENPYCKILSSERLDDYREVAPGCWLSFVQYNDRHNVDVAVPYIETHSVTVVKHAAINEPLPDDLFNIELVEGADVTTDWRYDPPIKYTYRKNQPEAERLQLQDEARRKRAETLMRNPPRPAR